MTDLSEAFLTAIRLMTSADRDLIEIVLLSFKVNGLAVFIACLIGLSTGALLAVYRFKGRTTILVCINALMGLPPVVVGLMVYMTLSNAGPLGVLGLLYTPTAMIIAQTILITPIIAALTRQSLELIYREYKEQLTSLGVGGIAMAKTLLWDGRYQLTTVILAGFGRAVAEVGAVMIVGGNINHLTRIMTTAIALETSKGDLALAMALGIILITIAFIINALVYAINSAAEHRAYA
ncbi:MAG: ABC transporter permease [Rhodomicrobium sp.]|nr:MAG: ABC transporter permease [Rhodomicrobium sp.]